MGHKKTKIVLDADVIIHFIEAGNFSLLPDIFPESLLSRKSGQVGL